MVELAGLPMPHLLLFFPEQLLMLVLQQALPELGSTAAGHCFDYWVISCI